MNENVIEKSEERVMLGVPDVMKLMGVGRNYAEKIMRGEHFPIVKVGRRHLVHKDVLNKWLKGESGKNRIVY